jgi:cell wall assembly regulator SMI1
MKIIWDRIHAWLAQHAPEVLASLGPGATDEQIHAAEQAMSITFPDDVKACYRLHDGQRVVPVTVPYWPGLRCEPPLLCGDRWLRLERMVERWQDLKGLLGDGTFDGISGSPRGPVRSDWWHPKWIPLTDLGGGGDLRCLDLAPRSRGNVGQVIFWYHDSAERGVLAKSFTEWLARFALELEQGQYTTAPERTPGLIHVRDL